MFSLKQLKILGGNSTRYCRYKLFMMGSRSGASLCWNNFRPGFHKKSAQVCRKCQHTFTGMWPSPQTNGLASIGATYNVITRPEVASCKSEFQYKSCARCDTKLKNRVQLASDALGGQNGERMNELTCVTVCVWSKRDRHKSSRMHATESWPNRVASLRTWHPLVATPFAPCRDFYYDQE